MGTLDDLLYGKNTKMKKEMRETVVILLFRLFFFVAYVRSKGGGAGWWVAFGRTKRNCFGIAIGLGVFFFFYQFDWASFDCCAE